MTNLTYLSKKIPHGYLRGIIVSIIIALAAQFLADHYTVPSMLLALLIGLSIHFIYEEKECKSGIDFTSNILLKMGVSLLGFRLSFERLSELGPPFILSTVLLTITTLMCGLVLSYVFGRKMAFGFLAGGSVAICGASAAIAIASVLPPKPGRDRDVLIVIIGVTVLSTIAMIVYPILFTALGMSNNQAGFLIGTTIHDVAQVIGAGYSVSQETGTTATFVKMIRVSLLPIFLFVTMMSFRDSQTKRLTLPWFLVLFVIAVLINNFFNLPTILTNSIASVSNWLLLISIAAIGIKTNLSSIRSVGIGYSVILILTTITLLLSSLAAIKVLDIL